MNTETKGSFRRLTKEEIAQAVKRFRKALDMKQYTLAVEAGIDERTVQRIEAGNEVSDESLARIAKVFGGAADLFTAPRLIMTEEQAEEQKLIRRLQMMMNMVMQVIAQDGSLSVDEAAQMIADSRKAALAMFPGKELAYDLIWRPRFQRLMRERFRIM